MAKKYTYRAKDVEKIDVEALIPLLITGCIIAIDVAKTKFVVGLATMEGAVQQVVRFLHPKQTLAFLALVQRLQRATANVQVVMEPTGVYGDAVRYQCAKAGCKVFMVRPKFTHDMAEVLDGVPSMHDGKAVHVLAQLHRMGRSTPWSPTCEHDRDLRALVDRRRFLGMMLKPAQGQMEALLSRWWPGLDKTLDVYNNKTIRAVLMTFGSPQQAAANEQETRELMRRVSRGTLRSDKVEAILACAQNTVAEPAVEGERQLIQHVVGQVDELSRKVEQVDQELREFAQNNEVIARMAKVVGVGTAATLYALIGDPRDFSSAKAYEKAFGLNLKVRSSGERAGQVAITKRGNGDCRQVMYMASLRMIHSCSIMSAWYKERRGYKAGNKKKAVVAVMRKLVRALWHVARGSAFDPTKLVDVRRLSIEELRSTQAA